MAFPVDSARTATNITTAANPLVINMPPTVNAGDTLIMIIRANNAGTYTNPSGWTQLVQEGTVPTEVQDDQIYIGWRKADGTEGGTTVSVTVSASGKAGALVYRITNAADPTVNPPLASSSVSSGSTGNTSPDCPSFTPTPGAQDYLWFAVGTWQGEQTSPPASAPTNYSNVGGGSSGTGGSTASNCRVASATRQLNAATEDPPAWSISAAGTWTCWTVVVQPQGAQVYTETATVYLDLQVSDSQAFAGTDAATVLVDLQASGTDIQAGPEVIEAHLFTPLIYDARASHLRGRKL